MILFVSNADTELLALRTIAEGLPEGFPALRATHPDRVATAPSLDGVELVVVRLLGGRRAWERGLRTLAEACAREGVPLLAFGGESIPDAELTELSSAPGATVVQAFEYLVQGGPRNLEHLLRFLVDTLLMEGFGFEPPMVVPDHGVYGRRPVLAGRPTVAVVFYRAHLVAGNTGFVDDLCDALERAGANALALYCYSLRPVAPGVPSPAVRLLAEHEVAAVVTTVLAAGSLPADADSWDPGELATLDVPVVQAVCATVGSERWESSTHGLSPIDVAMGMAAPEFDGRIVTVPFSFKEEVDDGEDLGVPVSAYRTVPDRTQRVAGLAVALARLRSRPVGERRIALVLSAYPTRRSRLGNAVGLDTPASVVALLGAMREAGYRVERLPESGDELMAELADGLTYDEPALAPEQAARAVGHWTAQAYADWFATLPDVARTAVQDTWGPPPGTVQVGTGGDLAFCGIDLGGVLVAVQPPRGFGEDPIAVYHSPDLPPTHHYLAFYRWLESGWGAHAVVHVGKHGTLEWLPGKGVGLSAACFPDAALGSLPLVYPFVVNDPGEGTQAKRRAHAVVVDHLVPPLTRAEAHDELARLEELLDIHAQTASLDPAKLPAVRRQVWDLLVEAEIHRDLGLGRGAAGDPSDPGGGSGPSFDDPSFDDLLVEVDGYLCELKDAQIRGGLHVLGTAPSGQAELDMVAAVTRLPQGSHRSLREEVAEAMGLLERLEAGDRRSVDAVEDEVARRLGALAAAGWTAPPDASESVRWICGRLLPDLRASVGEVGAVLGALDGRFVPPGPSGAPSRGMAHVLPTGRNFYSVDPRSIPTPLAWEVGRGLADRLLERHQAEEGRPPRTVGLVVWGTSAMRTGGDDIAEALALLGVRPVWDDVSRRVTGVRLIDREELGRPRVDVTLRVSGFFRDAFPHVIDLVNEAVALAAAADEPDGALARAGADEPRVFGPKPGAYGSGILNVLESGNWRDEQDLAEVYLAWGGWAYGRGGAGTPAADVLRRRLAVMEVAVKNQDNREHDIFDSDDYLQDHGGMVAAARALSGRQPKAWFGDSADPRRPRVRSLAEEAARVVRSRVVNPKWLVAMQQHGYKGAFEMAATVDYLFGYDATAGVVEDWMYERVTRAYVADPAMREFFGRSNPWALRAIAERLLEAADRGLWRASAGALEALRAAVLEAEGWEEAR